jgi:YHS domain-containing protein
MKLLLLVVLLFAGTALQAQSSKKLYNLDKSGLALEGYDPVAYFTQHKAIKGSKENAVSYQGVLYYFSNLANKELFKKSPAQYQPQYGGWCAYAMGASGEKVEVDPGTFKIAEGKLFLFYNKYFNNTLKSWDKDEKNLHPKADANWAKLASE